MGYKKTKPTVYVVHWPELDAIKVGYSEQQRWRAFLLRGAVLVDLVECDDYRDALALEDLMHRTLYKMCDHQPFQSAVEAIPYLGNGGGGWLECWQLPEDMTPMGLLSGIDWKAA